MSEQGTPYFRAVQHDPPRASDFWSDREAGKPRAPYELEADRDGRSVYAKLAKARDLAKWQSRRSGRQWYVAMVNVEPQGSFRVEQRGADRHHYTLWGDKTALARAAKIVWP